MTTPASLLARLRRRGIVLSVDFEGTIVGKGTLRPSEDIFIRANRRKVTDALIEDEPDLARRMSLRLHEERRRATAERAREIVADGGGLDPFWFSRFWP